MEELEDEACFVGVITGPRPGAAGLRGVVGCERGAVDGAAVAADGLDVEDGALGRCRASFPGEGNATGFA